MGGGVGGVLLDSSAILVAFDGGDNVSEIENVSLKPGADYLFRKLRHSNIPTGISYGPGLPIPKVRLLERISKQYSFGIFLLNSSTVEDTANEIARTWGDNSRSVLFVTCTIDEGLFVKLRNYGWVTIFLRSLGQKSSDGAGGGAASEESSMLFIDKLEELPLTICNLNKKVIGKDHIMVAYVMKPSREEDFAKRGAFPMSPTQNGLIFMPLTYELPISIQLQHVDVIIHKATDEIISIELSSSSGRLNKVVYNQGMLDLQRYLEKQPDCCVIDPFDNIYTVLDRFKIQQVLLGLEMLNTKGRCRIRGPHFLKVDNFDEPDLGQRLLEATLSPPCIVKPQVACGVAHAHSMAIVYKVGDYSGLTVPLPAIVQEYVDHSSIIFKFYVLGDKIFYAVKKSIPNADILIKLSEKDGLAPLLFDSLKSLPTSQGVEHSGSVGCNKVDNQQMDLGLVTDAAKWLKKMLNLTIFGFDVVVQEGTGDHVIVDVNYLPSFKEVSDDVALPAFWEVIKMKYESIKMNKQE